jgi:hypothetical protein
MGFHGECGKLWDPTSDFDGGDCCCDGEEFFGAATPALVDDEGTPLDAYFDGFTGSKPLSEYADPISTGRKEAAAKFPISKGLVCEWAWLKNAGGGALPIIGCPGYPATDIHHGPDKNTMRNVPGNVHRICVNCHNRWHGANDPLYPKVRPPADQPFIPDDGVYEEHDPLTKATDAEVFEAEGKRRDDSRRHGNL